MVEQSLYIAEGFVIFSTKTYESPEFTSLKREIPGAEFVFEGNDGKV